MNKTEIMSFQVITSCHNKVREQPQSQTRQELRQHVLIFVTTKHVVDTQLIFTRLSQGGIQKQHSAQILSITDVKLIHSSTFHISNLWLYLEHILLGRASHIL